MRAASEVRMTMFDHVTDPAQLEPTRPKRILIVDDDPETRRLYRFLFTTSGLSVEEAEDGLGALRKLKEQPIPLVITDLNMPQMDGIELIRSIRTDFPDIYLIL